MAGKAEAMKEQEEREYMTKEEILRKLFQGSMGRSDDELKAVWRELVKRYHPDNGYDNDEKAEVICALNAPDWLEIVKREINIFKTSNYGKTIEGYREGRFYGGTVEIPEGTEVICDGAFWIKWDGERQGPEKIIFPKTLRYIGENAFRLCAVREIVFKHGDQDKIEIDAGAFSGCWGLTKIEFPKRTRFYYPNSKGYGILEGTDVKQLHLWSGMENMGAAIPEKGGVKKVMLHDVTELKPRTFVGSHILVEASGSALEVIGESAFEGSCLDKIEFPSIKLVKKNAFKNVSLLGQISDAVNLFSVEKIEEEAFANCIRIKEVRLEGDLKQIGRAAFSGCKSLKKIGSLRSLTEVENEAFSGCESLEEIILPHVKRIGASAFKGCLKLKRVEMPSVEIIEDGAFEGCAALAKVRIPDSVQKIGSRIFASCTSLMVVSVNRENQGLFSRDAFEGCEKTAGELLVNPQWRPVRQSFCKSLVCENGLHLKSIPITLDNDMIIGGITVSAASAQVMITLHSYDRNEIKIQCLSLGHEPVEIEVRAELLLYGQGQIVVMKEAEQ